MTATLSEPLGALARLAPAGQRILSCYLSLAPEDRAQGKYQADLEQALRRLRKEVAGPSGSDDDRLALEADSASVLEFTANPDNLPNTPGVAIFACGARDLFELAPLPRVLRTRAGLDTIPLLKELIAVNEEFGVVLVAVCDRQHARIFEVTATSVAEKHCIPGLSAMGGRFRSSRRDAPGSGEAHWHRRLAEERHRLYHAIANALADLARGQAIRGIVVGGAPDHTAEMARFLPERLRTLLVGTPRLSPAHVTPSEVQGVVYDLVRQAEIQAEQKLLEQLEEEIGTGYAVRGDRETLHALARCQVRTLIVPLEHAREGWRCSGTARLALARAECWGEGEAIPIPNIADWAIEEALSHGAEVSVIRDPETASSLGGLAARLRFR